MYSLLQRLSSLRHGFCFGLSERIHWSRGAIEETAAGELCSGDLEQGERIAALRERYQVHFERRMNAATSANNYEYLDLLDRSWSESGLRRPAGGVLCDIGCANFWYAATLEAFFRPARLVGVEVEGYRLLRDGYSRIDYASGFRGCRLHPLPAAGRSHYRLVSVFDPQGAVGLASALVVAGSGPAVRPDPT
jgi:hypothetical protein